MKINYAGKRETMRFSGVIKLDRHQAYPVEPLRFVTIVGSRLPFAK
ncbi:MAG TPA: hypothetical protein VK165_17795 [Azonexus sp.]|nr:hypothetical protein [Azonexus sp.]